MEKGIESDQKLKHMAELQLSVVSDPASKHQIQVAAQLQNQLTEHARLLSYSCPLSLITTQNIRSEKQSHCACASQELQLSAVSDPASKHEIQVAAEGPSHCDCAYRKSACPRLVFFSSDWQSFVVRIPPGEEKNWFEYLFF